MYLLTELIIITHTLHNHTQNVNYIIASLYIVCCCIYTLKSLIIELSSVSIFVAVDGRDGDKFKQAHKCS